MKISACMIAKNEEKNIVRCINSYKDIVDEIIVVDTGSTDKTVEIAQDLGAKIYHFEWINDFARAKNFALSKAKGDWIIFLDADEYFAAGKSQNIPGLIKKYGRGKNQIIACKMINIDEQSGERLADIVQTRIFKNTKDIQYISAIHERLHSKKKNLHAIYIEENELVIYHTGYSHDVIQEKAKRNLELLLKEIEKPKTDPSMYHFLSDTYLTLKEYEKSIYYGKLFLKSKINVEGLNSKVYQNLISAMVESKQDWKEIYKIIYEAIQAFPNHPMFQMYLARSHHFNKRYQEALEGYEKTIKTQENYKGIEINFITGKIHEIEYPMACIYEEKNEEQKALDYYVSALKRKKDYLPALQGLLKLIRKIDITEVIALLDQLYDKNDPKEIAFLLEELTKQRYGKILAYYVNWMYKKFNHQDFSIVIMFLTNGNYEQAFKHFYEAYLSNYKNSYCKLAIVSAYLVENDKLLLKMKKIVKPSFKRIIEALLYIDQESTLYKEDLRDYLDILMELIKLEQKDKIISFIKIKSKFKENIENLTSTIGNILKENKSYTEALELYKQELQKENKEEKDIQYIYFSMGYCCYKLRCFKKALDYFKKAIESGYMENDIKEFLQWIMEQAKEDKVKKYAQALIQKFNEQKSEV